MRIVVADLGASFLPLNAYTLPQLSKAFGAPYRTLHSWVERDLLRPSIHRTTGTGRANLFDAQDALAVCVLTDLREAGVKLDLLRQAAQRLRDRRDELDTPMFLLVNGDVEIVSNANQVAVALERGGLTLAYHTGNALARVEELRVSSATHPRRETAARELTNQSR